MSAFPRPNSESANMSRLERSHRKQKGSHNGSLLSFNVFCLLS
ncbi:hypothetical protein VCR12J2_970012 [Vibrio coralliirubri]|nr:hypothetical protein VCR12J2_970012 [Vibrio coralliirubri]